MSDRHSLLLAKRFQIVLHFLALCFFLMSGREPAVAQQQSCPKESDSRWELFAMDNGVGRDEGWTPDQQAELLAKLGFSGIGYTGTNGWEPRMAAMAERGLHVYTLYTPCYLDRAEPFDQSVDDLLPKLQGTTAHLWIYFPTKGTDELAVAALQKLADAAAKYDVPVAIYPHHAYYIETVTHALKIVEAVDRANVGLSLNLCHELRAGNGERLDEIVEQVADKIMLVSINGAFVPQEWMPETQTDRQAYHRQLGWDRLIRPLDEGDFEVAQLLQTLERAGYTGPIGLQSFGIRLPPAEKLGRSIQAWHRLCK